MNLNDVIPLNDLPTALVSDNDFMVATRRSDGKAVKVVLPEVNAAARAVGEAINGVVSSALDSAQSVLAGLGYLPPVAYESGLSVTSSQFTVSYGAQVFAPVPSAIPFVTGAVFDASKWRLIDGVKAVDLAGAAGAALVGFKQAGADSVTRTVLAKLRDISESPEDYYVEADGGYWGAAINRALAASNVVRLTRGKNYVLNIQTEADVIRVTSGKYLIGEGATITWGRTSGYLPAIAMVDSADCGVVGPLNIVNTGTADGVESVDSTSVTRLGKNRVPRSFNCAIYLDGCERYTVSDIKFSGSDATKNATYAVYAATNGIGIIENIFGRDCAIVVGTGTSRATIRNVWGDYLNGTNTIPGHVIYAFGADEIDGVHDGGNRSVYPDNILHTLSLKGTTQGTIVRSINSKGSIGPLNLQDCAGVDASGIVWTDPGTGSVDVSYGAIFVNDTDGTTKRNTIRASLKTSRDRPLISVKGFYNNLDISMEKVVSVDHVTPFAILDTRGSTMRLRMVTTGSFRTPHISTKSAYRDCDVDIVLGGYVQPLNIDSVGGARVRYTISNEEVADGDVVFRDRPLDMTYLAQFPDLVSQTCLFGSRPVRLNYEFKSSGSPASVSQTAQFPRQGTFLVSVTIAKPDRSLGVTATYLVAFDDYYGDFTSVQQLGTTVQKGVTTFTGLTVTVSNRGLLTITAAMSSAQDYVVNVGALTLASWGS